MTPEHKLMNQVRLECSKRGYVVIRMNVFKGILIDPNGNDRYMDSGIPEGFPDLMVLRNDGKACFVETKIHPRKPTKIQLQRQELLRSLGYQAGTAYTVDEAMEIIEKD